MKNPLHSLDELVWKQFSKLTAYAHQRCGWNNYDLAQAAFAGVGLTLAGEGSRQLYDALQPGSLDDPAKRGISAILGSMYLLLAYPLYKGMKEKFSSDSKKDYAQSLRREYFFQYQPEIIRPLIAAGSAYCLLPTAFNGLAFLLFLTTAAGLYFSHQEFRPSRRKRNKAGRMVFK